MRQKVPEMSEDASGNVNDAGVNTEHLKQTALGILDHVVTTMNGAPRAGQQMMVKEICQALSGQHLVVQAGTGTGKSLGYLVPIMTDCALNQHRALISTATLALQRQITVHDAPLVHDALKEKTGKEASVSVLKGWSNYVCLQRVGGGTVEASLFDADTAIGAAKTTDLGAQVLRVREWAADSATGDRDDLVPGVSDQVWHQVSVSKRECLGKSCPLLEQCFAQRARQKALSSDVVVTNHSMVGIEAINGVELFGDIDIVVIDEAHALAERVRSQACQHLSTGIIRRVARRIHRLAKVDTDQLEQAGALFGVAITSVEDGLIEQRSPQLNEAIATLDNVVRDAYTQVEQSGVDQAEKLVARGSLDELDGFLEAWNQEADRSITWMQRDARAGTEELVVGPLDVAGPIGKRALGSKPAVLTSATLAMGGSFQAIGFECGLAISDVPWKGIDVGTPFAPAQQGIMYVAKDLPAPGREGPSQAMLDRLVQLAKASDGGMLALFSSWRGAQAGAEALREHTDLEILLQGEETTSALVSRFRDHVDSCLVATLGLWQGVDVAGPACRLVVMDRIPFPHPNDPVFKARSRDAQKRGLNGFRTIQLTHAALLMAQGAGRLLRSINDRGMVAILDSRVVTKSYGAFIRQSLPALWPTTDKNVAIAALERLAKQN